MPRKLKEDIDDSKKIETENIETEIKNEEFRMDIHQLVVIPKGETKIVRNCGGGDLYVSEDKLITDKSTLLSPDTEKTFKGDKDLYLYSYSRPLVLIRYAG